MNWINGALVISCIVLFNLNAQVSVLTQHNNIARTGANLSETVLTTANVNLNTFGKLFARTVDGQIYAQPLYVPNLAIPGQGTHNVVFVATEHNSVFAFDADNPAASAPLWQVNLGPPVLPGDITRCTTTVPGISTEIGITATPVIDPSTYTMYVVVPTEESSVFYYRLHALDITTGLEKTGSPVLIQGTVPGNGWGDNGHGSVIFQPLGQLNRPGLLLMNGTVYMAFASHCDEWPFHGWVMGYDAGTLQQVAIFNSTPTSWGSGVWQSGGGLAADANGIYLATGNGAFDANTSGGVNYGDSIIRLGVPSLTVQSWFSPYDNSTLAANDGDLGVSGPMLLPGTNLLVNGSKEGILYVVDRTNMGGFNSLNNSQIVQSITGVSAGHIHGSPVYWSGPNGNFIYVWGENDHLKQYQFTAGTFQATPFATSSVAVPPGMPGGFLSLSANGSTAGSGIIWAAQPLSGDANEGTVPGMVRAFDAENIGTELWNSQQNVSRDGVGNFAKFCPPTVANGKMYLATFSNQLLVYGLVPSGSGPTAPTNPALSNATTSSLLFSWGPATSSVGIAGYRFDVSNNSLFTSFLTGYAARNVGKATSWTISGLTQGITIYARVRAYDTTGVTGPNSTIAKGQTLGTADTTPPSPPTNPQLSNPTSSSLLFTWTAASDNVGVSGYRIDVATDPAFTSRVSGYSARNVGNVTSWTISGLPAGVTYYARVRAYDLAGNTGSNSATAQGATSP